MATYAVEVIHRDRPAWFDELRDAVEAELAALGVQKYVEVQVSVDPPAIEPAVTVFLGSHAAAADMGCVAAVGTALGQARTVLPIVENLNDFTASVPPSLQPVNGLEWSGPDVARRLARRTLEQLGIEDRQRRVFISHRRLDGLVAAEQLHDYLSHRGFEPFIDRFAIGPGVDVQRRIAEALEDCAFLLLLETPEASASPWVFYEVDYALTHTMGMHIVRWPNDPAELPGSNRLPRQTLQPADLTVDKGYDAFTEAALDAIHCEVEAAHAAALARRRRQLLRSVEDAAEIKGLTCTPLPDWHLLVQGGAEVDIVGVSSRIPTVEDLYTLDQARVGSAATPTRATMVHSARRIEADRMAVLAWSVGHRPVALVPENAIGGYW